MALFQNHESAGVIYVMDQAVRQGYQPQAHDWANLGQGSAELSGFQNCPSRQKQIRIQANQGGYAPVNGLPELRKKVACLYNDLFRTDQQTQFTQDNVCVGGGGRVVLSRIIASLGQAKVGFLLPDYASYEGILSCFQGVKPVPINLKESDGFQINVDHIQNQIKKAGLDALLLSNPSNPTGNVLEKAELKKLVATARKHNCYLILDEFYFNYLYSNKSKKMFVSAAEYLKNPDQDPVILVCGLSKAWRYSGWRLCWSLAPREITQAISSAGSFLDGGANHPLQHAALKLINKDLLIKETRILQKHFAKKRDYLLNKLKQIGFVINNKPQGAFYVWASLKKLPNSINTDIAFFQQALEHKVICVPGRFFHLSPNQKQSKRKFTQFIRFSYGPDFQTLKIGITSIQKLVEKHKIAQANTSKWKLRSDQPLLEGELCGI
ncbi:MAG: aminotransferase class I/II-fold pyridoxal phosphate-dependent enzyme [Candidatus Moranbacteria bacterium]|nr:aminotransferase class I/II-fold pyridoxal phosphate-dependent enzyme [Candidatus Moranbacteria bacterium]